MMLHLRRRKLEINKILRSHACKLIKVRFLQLPRHDLAEAVRRNWTLLFQTFGSGRNFCALGKHDEDAYLG